MLVFINAAKGVTKANVFVTSMSKNHMVAVMNLKALSVAKRWGYECGGSDPLATYIHICANMYYILRTVCWRQTKLRKTGGVHFPRRRILR